MATSTYSSNPLLMILLQYNFLLGFQNQLLQQAESAPSSCVVFDKNFGLFLMSVAFDSHLCKECSFRNLSSWICRKVAVIWSNRTWCWWWCEECAVLQLFEVTIGLGFEEGRRIAWHGGGGAGGRECEGTGWTTTPCEGALAFQCGGSEAAFAATQLALRCCHPVPSLSSCESIPALWKNSFFSCGTCCFTVPRSRALSNHLAAHLSSRDFIGRVIVLFPDSSRLYILFVLLISVPFCVTFTLGGFIRNRQICGRRHKLLPNFFTLAVKVSCLILLISS